MASLHRQSGDKDSSATSWLRARLRCTALSKMCVCVCARALYREQYNREQYSGADAGQAYKLEESPYPLKSVLPPPLGGDLIAHS